MEPLRGDDDDDNDDDEKLLFPSNEQNQLQQENTPTATDDPSPIQANENEMTESSTFDESAFLAEPEKSDSENKIDSNEIIKLLGKALKIKKETQSNEAKISLEKSEDDKSLYLSQDVYLFQSLIQQEEEKPKFAVPQEKKKPRRKLSDLGLPQTILEKYTQKGVIELFDWQNDILTMNSVVKQCKNLIYTAPTSGGKSLVAEILMALKLRNEIGKKIFYIVPFIALAEQKTRDFANILKDFDAHVVGYFGGQRVCHSGFMHEKEDLIVCTIEAANMQINKLIVAGDLTKVSMVVVDEFHLIGDSNRGHMIELLLTKLLYYRAPIQIIAMSATLPVAENSQQNLARWLNAELYNNSERPIPLKNFVFFDKGLKDVSGKHVKDYSSILPKNPMNDDELIPLCQEMIDKGLSTLIFCDTIVRTSQIAEKLRKSLKIAPNPDREQLVRELEQKSTIKISTQMKECLNSGVVFHNASLCMEERETIEKGFEKGQIMVICCTTTLSAGINLPVRRVIFSERNSCIKLDLTTFLQASGRAGRLGKDEEGECIFMCKGQSEFEKVKHDYFDGVLEPIHSCLEQCSSIGMKRLLVDAIASGTVKTDQEIAQLIKSTLLYALKKNTSGDTTDEAFATNLRENLLVSLQKSRIIRTIPTNTGTKEYAPSLFGKAIFRSGFDVENSRFLYRELNKASVEGVTLYYPLHLLYFVSSTEKSSDITQPRQKWEELNKNFQRIPGSFLKDAMAQQMLSRMEIDLDQPNSALFGFPPDNNYQMMKYTHFWNAFILYSVLDEKSYVEIEENFWIPRGRVQKLVQEATQLCSMVIEFCKTMNFDFLTFIFEGLRKRLIHCVKAELLDYMDLPHMNPKKARFLLKLPIEIPTIAVMDPVHLFGHFSKAFDVSLSECEEIVEAAKKITFESTMGSTTTLNTKYSASKSGEKNNGALQPNAKSPPSTFLSQVTFPSRLVFESPSPPRKKNAIPLRDGAFDDPQPSSDDSSNSSFSKSISTPPIEGQKPKNFSPLPGFMKSDHLPASNENEVTSEPGKKSPPSFFSNMLGNNNNSAPIKPKFSLFGNNIPNKNVPNPNHFPNPSTSNTKTTANTSPNSSPTQTKQLFPESNTTNPGVKPVANNIFPTPTQNKVNTTPQNQNHNIFGNIKKPSPPSGSLGASLPKKTSPTSLQLSNSFGGGQTTGTNPNFSNLATNNSNHPVNPGSFGSDDNKPIIHNCFQNKAPQLGSITQNCFQNKAPQLGSALQPAPVIAPLNPKPNATITKQPQQQESVSVPHQEFPVKKEILPFPIINQGLVKNEIASKPSVSFPMQPQLPEQKAKDSQEKAKVKKETKKAQKTQADVFRELNFSDTNNAGESLFVASSSAAKSAKPKSKKSSSRKKKREEQKNFFDSNSEDDQKSDEDLFGEQNPKKRKIDNAIPSIFKVSEIDATTSDFEVVWNLMSTRKVCSVSIVLEKIMNDPMRRKKLNSICCCFAKDAETDTKIFDFVSRYAFPHKFANSTKNASGLTGSIPKISPESIRIKDESPSNIPIQKPEDFKLMPEDYNQLFKIDFRRDKDTSIQQKFFKKMLANDNSDRFYVVYGTKTMFSFMRKELSMRHFDSIVKRIFDPIYAENLLEWSEIPRDLHVDDTEEDLRTIDKSIEKNLPPLRKFQVDSKNVNCLRITESLLSIHLLCFFLPLLAKENMIYQFVHLDCSIIPLVGKMDGSGIGFDSKLTREIHEKFKKRVNALEDEVNEVAKQNGMVDFNIRSPNDVSDLLYGKLKIPVPPGADKGKRNTPSTGKEYLKLMTHEVAKKIKEFREVEKRKGSYLETWANHAVEDPVTKVERIFSNTFISNAVTGRFSMSEPNLQSIPKPYDFQSDDYCEAEAVQQRDCFVAKEGYVFVDADYNQIESRLIAHFSGDVDLVALFKKGKDIFKILASRIFESAQNDPEKVTPDQRNEAKTVWYAICYGMGDATLAQKLQQPFTTAQRLKKQIFERFQGIKTFNLECINEFENRGYVSTIFGRKRRKMKEKSSGNFEGSHVAMNSKCQGSAADIIKKAMIDINTEIEKLEQEKQEIEICNPVLQIHDELLFEVKKEYVQQVAKIVRDKMENVYPKLKVPLKAQVKSGPRFGSLVPMDF